jgi:hypothetical protein
MSLYANESKPFGYNRRQRCSGVVTMKRNVPQALFALLALSALIGCGGQPSSETERESTSSSEKSIKDQKPSSADVALSIPSLALKSPKQIDSKLGIPSSIVPITNNSAYMPGEYREYKTFSKDFPAIIRFHKGKAVQFTLQLDKAVENPYVLLGSFGFHELPENPDKEAPAGLRWYSPRINSFRFTEVAVENSAIDGSTGWVVVSAKVQE